MKTHTWIVRPLDQWIAYPPNCCSWSRIRQLPKVSHANLQSPSPCSLYASPSRCDAFHRLPVTGPDVANYFRLSYQSPVTNRGKLHPTPVISCPSAALRSFARSTFIAQQVPFTRYRTVLPLINNYGIALLANSVVGGRVPLPHCVLPGDQV